MAREKVPVPTPPGGLSSAPVLWERGSNPVGFSTFSREFPNLDFYENSASYAPSIHSFNIYPVTTMSCSKPEDTSENKTDKSPYLGGTSSLMGETSNSKNYINY